MQSVTFDRTGFQFHGTDSFFVSGEFHYFRVPREDWQRRMRLFREAGGNTLATYVPWLIHEPAEGDIRFDDVAYRDLTGFLQSAQAEGLQVVLRPGPYSYSELINSGMPDWLVENYPQLMAKNLAGESFASDAVSYLHPLFLEKVRPFFRAFAQVVKPFLSVNGGPVCMLQVDNELGGIHIWRGSLDYNRTTMGIGQPGGRYPQFLEKKYGTVETLNEHYGTSFQDFVSVMPTAGNNRELYATRRARDYFDFYCGTLGEFAALLADWLVEDGLTGPFCHNAASPSMDAWFRETVDAMGKDFLLGSDHYYTLNQAWPQYSPTPRYAVRVFASNEMLRLLGMPPTVLEMPGGTPSDTPPILPEDLLACYRTNLAMGLKGVNFYIYTGGPNVPGTGDTCDIYDYHAPVAADGSLAPHFRSLEDFCTFMANNGWMQRASLTSSVQVGFEWAAARTENLDLRTQPVSLSACWDFLQYGILYSLFCSSHRPALHPLDRKPDLSKPLLVPAASAMSRQAQENLAEFVRAGGNLILMGAMPETDLDYRPCTVLRQLCGDPELTPPPYGYMSVDVPQAGLRVYNLDAVAAVKTLPEGAEILAKDTRKGAVMGYRLPVGKGKVTWLGCKFVMKTFDQSKLLEWLLDNAEAQAVLGSENRNIFTTLWQDETGRGLVCILNLYSSPQTTRVTLFPGTAQERDLGEHRLAAMEVKLLEI